MSLHPDSDPSVPDDTAAVARAVFPQGTGCLRLRDRLGPIFADEQFASLFPKSGQPAECPWRLALVTLLQFGENLSDRRAADAVRSRIDWKYLLGLSLEDPGFNASVLSEFRSRLVKGGAESLLFDRLLVLCREQGFLVQHGRQRTDSTHVIGAVRSLTRLACAIETLRAALEALAVAAPDWLRPHADKAWAERYERRGGDVDGRRLRLSSAVPAISVGHPVPDGLGGGFKLAGDILRIATGSDQVDHLLPELRRVRRACLGHRGTPHAKASSVSIETIPLANAVLPFRSLIDR